MTTIFKDVSPEVAFTLCPKEAIKAEHANEKQTTNLPGLTGERVKAGVTIVVTLYALINAGLNLAGYNTLPFTDEQVSTTVFSVIGVIGTIYGWWKNQNITSASLAGQQLVDALK